MIRVLSIWLPNLAIERWRKTGGFAPDACPEPFDAACGVGQDKLRRGEPVVLTLEGAHGPIIHAVTEAAAERGARAGARLTDARALDPKLIAVPADTRGDEAMLERLARWAGRWSPLIEVDGPDALRLDVSGVAHLFGGEGGLAEDVRSRFAALGLTVRLAIAPTAAAAWALAHHAPCLCGSAELEARLAPLHVSALQLEPETVQTLERLGLKTIGAVTALPRLALARRFRGDEDVVEALDRLVGRRPEPLTALAANPPPRAALRLEEPASHPEAAPQALATLIPPLVSELEERRLGARRLSLHAFRVDGTVAQSSVATAIASRDPKHLQRLLSDKAAALEPGFGFDAFVLVADWTESLGAAQESLVEEPSGERDLARLVDRLSVKLGGRMVRRPQAFESHVPERASGWVSAVANSPSPHGGGGREPRSGGRERGRNLIRPLSPTPLPRRGEGLSFRPPRLLDRPEVIAVVYATPEGIPRRFVWRRAVHDIARVEGPERIAPEWWRERSTARLRDYYRVEDGAGRRYWIYREGVIGDGRGGAPNWYLHGLFG